MPTPHSPGDPTGAYEVVITDAVMDQFSRMSDREQDEFAQAVGRLRANPQSVGVMLVPHTVTLPTDAPPVRLPDIRTRGALRDAVVTISPDTGTDFDREMEADLAEPNDHLRMRRLRTSAMRWCEYIAIQGDPDLRNRWTAMTNLTDPNDIADEFNRIMGVIQDGCYGPDGPNVTCVWSSQQRSWIAHDPVTGLEVPGPSHDDAVHELEKSILCALTG